MANYIDSVFDYVESSNVIQKAKDLYNSATTQEEKALAHQIAENYRKEVGGYSSSDGARENVKITNADTAAAVAVSLNPLKNAAQQVTNFAATVVDNKNGSNYYEDLQTVKQELTQQEAQKEKLTIIDSELNNSSGSYDPGYYSVPVVSDLSGTNFDTIAGYGLIGLIFIAVLSKIMK